MSTTPNAQLHVKSYFARSIQSAIELAGREMGAGRLAAEFPSGAPGSPSSWRVRSRFWQLSAKPPGRAPSAAPTGEMAGLRQQMDEIRSLLLRASMTPGAAHGAAAYSSNACCVDAGLEPGLAAEIEAAVGASDEPALGHGDFTSPQTAGVGHGCRGQGDRAGDR